MHNKSITIAEHTIKPGTKKIITIASTDLYTQSKLEIPVHVFHGKKAGPKVFIISTLHGDEFNGIEIIRRLLHRAELNKIHGTLLAIPVANIFGFMNRSRYMPDRRDLNRSFPGSKKGSSAARLAKMIMDEIVIHCDYGVDLHSGTAGHLNMPQLRISKDDRNIKQLAIAFGAPVILSAKLRNHSLRAATHKLGTPLLVFEGGEALRVNELCVRMGVHGILNLLAYLNMIPDTNIKPTATFNNQPIFSKTYKWVRANSSGLMQPIAEITKTAKKGDILAYIHDPFQMNKSRKIRAPYDCMIIGQTNCPIINEGDALYNIAKIENTEHATAYIDELCQEVNQPKHRLLIYQMR